MSLPLSAMESLPGSAETVSELNKDNPFLQWNLPSMAVLSMMFCTAYGSPCLDTASGLDLSSIAQLDDDVQRAKIAKLGPSSSVTLRLSLLESWEQREHLCMVMMS